MMKMRLLSGSLAAILFSITLNAQEVITGISGNPVAQDYYSNYSSPKKSSSADTLELPFIDDFSNSFVEPDPRLWSDKHAFINTTYPVFPISVGVATLDALDFDGSHYQNASSNPYPADYLTSKPINLSYSASDSIWLSFFYQPQGLGEQPEAQDSLCLDFYDPEEMVWVNVWSVPGHPLKPFERVLINISEERFLKKGFRFRFRNYASLPDNQDYSDFRDNKDHWHIDYVILNKNRHAADTVLRDVAFIEPLRSFLKDYESIPWRHFEQAFFTQLKPFIGVKYINHDTVTRNVTRVLQITDLQSGTKYSPLPTANDINPGDSTIYNFPYAYPFNLGTGDSVKFQILAYLMTDAFDYKPNDTIKYIQTLKDYYALDDGTAEAGYGLRGAGTPNASVAVKFNSFREDSLRAIDMYFNQLPDSANLNYYFYLRIWGNNNGRPGQLRYSQIGMRPKYSESLTSFQRYMLDSTIVVKDTFFIGFTQTVDKLINIGFDRNRNSSQRNYYTSSGNWLRSGFPGTIMIRPVVSLNPIVSTFPEKAYNPEYIIYPNPASEIIHIKLENPASFDRFYIDITDLSGRTVFYNEIFDRTPLDISELRSGLYLAKLQNSKKHVLGVQKLIIHK